MTSEEHIAIVVHLFLNAEHDYAREGMWLELRDALSLPHNLLVDGKWRETLVRDARGDASDWEASVRASFAEHEAAESRRMQKTWAHQTAHDRVF